MAEDLKKCTNCTRGPQPLKDFENESGRVFRTCMRCREKGRKQDQKPERKEQHDVKQQEKSSEYSKRHREKKKSGITDEHNLGQKCEWSKSEKSVDRLSKWKRLNVKDRISSSRRQANAKGIEWCITDAEAEKMMTSPCVYCNHIDLTVRLNGLDRLNQQGNYTTENTVACCWTCNFMKGCFDPKTFIEQCKKISKCIYEFPEVPIQSNIRPRKPTAPQLPTLQSLPKTPPQ